jgi:hypothetical protein
MNYTTLHRKLKIEQDERHVKHLGWTKGLLKGKFLPFVLLLNDTTII